MYCSKKLILYKRDPTGRLQVGRNDMENLVVDVDGNRICLCERGGFHNGVLERPSLLECKAVYL